MSVNEFDSHAKAVFNLGKASTRSNQHYVWLPKLALKLALFFVTLHRKRSLSETFRLVVMLSKVEKQELLSVARHAIERRLKGFVSPPDTAFYENLLRPGGAFVTIRVEQELRGCIGYIESEKPLVQVVAEVAARAATEDTRFPPMTVHELDLASIEVSVLSPLCRILSIDEIEIGTHGLVVALGMNRGLLLPQVATEHSLDRESFFAAALHKAGIPLGMRYLPELEIFVFEAEVLHEVNVLQ